MSDFLTRASDFGYNFDSLPEYMKNNCDVGRSVYDIAYLPEGSDDEIDLGLAYSIEEVEKIIRLHAKRHEPDLLASIKGE